MYRLTFDGYTIYDPRAEDYLIRDPSAHLAIGEPGSLSFTLDHDHPGLNHLNPMRGVLELTEDGVVIYRGRITKDEKGFDLSHVVESEGMLACLNDSIIHPFSFPEDVQSDPGYIAAAASGNVVQYFLSWLLSQHNAQVTAEQQIQLGTVTVTDPNNYIARACTEYNNTWKTIQDKLAGSTLGGYLLVRYEAGGNYLDYYDDLPLTNTQVVEFGENLLDLVSELEARDLYSAILPVGAEGLTLASLPDGAIDSDLTKSGSVIYSSSRRTAYGNITKVEKWDDVTEATNLRTKAAAKLAASGYAQTITVKACDLHYSDADIYPFRVGRYVRLTSSPHGFSALYPLTELEPDLMDPGNTEITLGYTETTLTAWNKQVASDAEDRMDQQQMQLDKTIREIDDIPTAVTEQITSAVQTSQSIIFSALEAYTLTGDLEAYKREVSTQFSIMAGQIEMTFRTATEQIEDVNGDLQAKYSERVRYIRFVDGSIILGEEGNQITLVQTNDRLSFKQDGLEVAWFSNNQLHVTQGEFTTTAKIGKFAFVPGDNGNLSFRKVED